ncbi:Bug family tripartite tricarboxylate transporter substrate binding protein [Acuticoccus mangrovi]|uniref:Tripartite tricarboxylate transporter substrate binding protein n=1 Tax=Acuticoccus mangrovi TaxID=2796142 RepID=A0A934ILG5_9HYPH|nr:tripartite tricarboxylate transporter substrate binding protein [Acuticoccus mangrovi]MBJ3778789.1 tripartite tricarboxylate transporter substrate binding protein [Acuticoccus mangrovi]
MHKTLALTGALLAAVCGSVTGALADDYPTKPVEFIVPWSPGGGSDTLMRIISNNVEPYLGQPMPVINMPGVSGTVGLKEAAQRDADGYTIAQIHEGLLVSNATGLTDLNWDTFEPVALMTASPQFLVVNADSDWQTFEEFAEYAKANPGAIKVGVTLAGVPHLHAAMIEDAIGAEFSYVGYEGTGQRIRALVGGNLDAAIGDIASSLQFVENGDLRFLAVGSAEPMAAVPDVPTLKSLGYDMELAVTRGIVMPKGSPDAARDTLEAALGELSEDETFVEQLNNAGAEADFRGHEAYTKYLESLDTAIERLSDKLGG